MIKFYIPKDIKPQGRLLSLFVIDEGRIHIDKRLKSSFSLVQEIQACDYVIIPFSILRFFKDFHARLETVVEESKRHEKVLLIVHGSDFEPHFSHENVVFLTPTIEAKRPDCILIPAIVDDRYDQSADIVINRKVGFVGQSTASPAQLIKYSVKILIGLLSYILKIKLEKPKISYPMIYRKFGIFRIKKVMETDIIERKKYAAKGIPKELSKNEYFTNIKENSFTYCPRGTGNYSQRFFEVLMMGRIPIVDLKKSFFPFSSDVNWNSVVLDYNEIMNNPEIVRDMSEEDLIAKQKLAREVWINFCSYDGFYQMLHNHLMNNPVELIKQG